MPGVEQVASPEVMGLLLKPILQRRCVMVLCRYVNRIGVCWQTLICLVHTSKQYNNKMHSQSVSSLRESSIATRRADPCCE